MLRIILGLIAIAALCGFGGEAARVGTVVISGSSVDNVTKFYDPAYATGGGKDPTKRYLGLALLIRKDLAEQLLAANGVKLDDKKLDSAAKEMEANPVSRNAFKRIASITGNNRNALLHDFVAMSVSENMLKTEVFLKKTVQRRGQLKGAADALVKETTAAPSSFAQQAAKKGFRVCKVMVTPAGIKTADNGGKPLSSSMSQATTSYLAAAKSYKAGQVFPESFEIVDSFIVARFIKKIENGALYEAALIPKPAYEEWFWQGAGKIPVHIGDKMLKKKIMENAQWAKHLKLN